MFVEIILGLASLCLYCYYMFTRTFGKWEAKGIPCVEKPVPLFGNQWPLMTGELSPTQLALKRYDAHKGLKYGVIYMGTEPLLYLRDLDLIKQVMTVDHDHFVDAGFIIGINEFSEANNFGLVTARGERWRKAKAMVTPYMSIKSVKKFVPHVEKVSDAFVEEAARLARLNKDNVVDVEKIVDGYMMDCMTRFLFRFEFGSIKKPDSNYAKAMKALYDDWRFLLPFVMPTWVYELLGVSLTNPKSTGLFTAIAKDLLAKAKKKTDKELEEADDIVSFLLLHRKGRESDIPDRVIIYTLLQFLMDGVESVGGLGTVGLYFFAMNPEFQERLHKEVSEKSNPEDMQLLDETCFEILRLIGFIETHRICTKPWTIPDTDITIPVGMRVQFSNASIMRDPEFYHEPEKFDPERFADHRRQQLTATGMYMPFGMGPRQCLGNQIGRLNMKMLFIKVLRHFRVEPSAKTNREIVFSASGFGRLEGGCKLKLTPRK